MQRGGLLLGIVVVVAMVTAGGARGVRTADAGRLAVAQTHAEADLADEAGGFTLLLEAALDRPDRPVVPAVELEGVVVDLDQAGPVLARLGADAVVACDLSRGAVGLRVSFIVIDGSGAVAVAGAVEAGEGDLRRLVDGVAAQVATVGGPARPAPVASVGQLRAAVRAAEALRRGDRAGAAALVATIDPLIALRVPSVSTALRPGWAGATVEHAIAVRIAVAAATPQEIFDQAGTGTTPLERAARALAHLAVSDDAAAVRELAGGGDHPLLAVARARLAYRKGKTVELAAALKPLIAAGVPEALAFTAELPAGVLAPAVEDAALAAASKPNAPTRVAAVLGLRAAEAGRDPGRGLALIRVVELDDAEVERLAVIVERELAKGSRPALRLRAEIAARRADPAVLRKAVDDWLASGANDLDAQLWRGRLAVTSGDLVAARAAFAKAGATREEARVALAAGDLEAAEKLLADAPADSVERRVVAAERALARGDAGLAATELRLARQAAPASSTVAHALAKALGASDPDAAKRAARLAERIDQGAAATAVALGGGGGGSAAGSGTGRGTGTGTGPEAKAVSLDPGLAAELEPLLVALPIPARARVALVELPSGAGLFALHSARPAVLRDALVAMLERRGSVTTIARRPVTEPLRTEALEALADDLGVDALLLYRLTADGSRARVRLVSFGRAASAAHEVDRTIPGTRHGLVGWNATLVSLAVILLALAVVIAAFVYIRGRSRIEVRIILDPDGRDEVLALEVKASPDRPEIPDPGKFKKDMRREGQDVGKRHARLPGPRTIFRVPPGTWHVHLYGVYTRDHRDHVVPPMHSRAVDVKRGALAKIELDLGLKTAEVQVTVHDARRAGVALWLDSAAGSKMYTDSGGTATLYVPVGQHVLHVDAHGLRLDRPLSILAPKIERVAINLTRERRLAEVSDGLTLGSLGVGSAVDEVSERAMPAVAPPVARQAAMPVVTMPVGTLPTTLAVGSEPGPVTQAAAQAPTIAGVAPPPSTLIRRAMAEPVVSDRILGRYRVEAELGRGAMGVVFKAWDENLERTVAVKVLSRDLKDVPQALTLFVQEAKSLAQLHHPNIVSVFDQVADGDENYIIMEFVDGTTVAHLLTEHGTLPVRTALGVIDQLCAGLGYAHGKKVIHRDIKPANVFVSREKVVKLGDFGIARVMRELEIRRTDVRGTPLYMSPEQIKGENINHRADLYAVGCTLFELIAGRPPFIDGNVMAHHLFTEPPVLSELVPGTPAALDELILACLQKEADERIESAAAISVRLRAIAAAVPR